MAILEVYDGMIVQSWEDGKLFTVSAKRIISFKVKYARGVGHGKNKM